MIASGGVEVHAPGWVAIVILVGSLAGAGTAITMFTRKVIVPAARGLAAITENMRVMADIADRFGDQGHETISAELRALAVNDELSADNQQKILEHLAAIADRTEGIDSKLSETRHKIIGEFATLKLGGESTLSVVEALERTSTMLLEVKEDLRLMKNDIAVLRSTE